MTATMLQRFTLLLLIGFAEACDSSCFGADALKLPRQRRCGLLVSLATLQMYGINYNIESISSALSVTERGLSMQQLADLFTSHGLNVAARKQASLEELSKFLTSDKCAVMPVELAPEVLHFVILTRRPGDDTLYMLDPPNGFVAVSGLHDTLLKSCGGACLIIQSEIVRPGILEEGVRFEPTVKRMAPLTNATGFQEMSLKLINENDRPLAIVLETGSCACFTPTSKTHILNAKSQTDLKFRVENAELAKPGRQWEVRALYLGEPIAQCRIEASTQNASNASVKPELINIQLSADTWNLLKTSPHLGTSLPEMAKLKIAMYDANLMFDKITMKSDINLFDVEFTLNSDSVNASLSASDDAGRILTQHLADCNSRLRGSLQFQRPHQMDLCSASFVISRESLVRFTQTSYTIDKDRNTVTLNLAVLSDDIYRNADDHSEAVYVCNASSASLPLSRQLSFHNGQIKIEIDAKEFIAFPALLNVVVSHDGHKEQASAVVHNSF